MKTININDKNLYKTVNKVLWDGGVVMHPTETCYGLAVDVFNKSALKKLYELKEMSTDKPVSILIDSVGMAQEFGLFSDKAFDLASEYWPGPLSILVPRSKELPDFLNEDNDFVSMRHSSMDFCMNMVEEFGRPVTTTSANKTTESQLYLPDASSLKGVDLLVDGGEIKSNKPSTIVKVDGDNLTILRQGDLVLRQID
mgnify:CR=1 FL=1